MTSHSTTRSIARHLSLTAMFCALVLPACFYEDTYLDRLDMSGPDTPEMSVPDMDRPDLSDPEDMPTSDLSEPDLQDAVDAAPDAPLDDMGDLSCPGWTLPEEPLDLDADCDQNGVPDTQDLSAGRLDCNANGILDACEHLSDVCITTRSSPTDPQEIWYEHRSGTLPIILHVPHDGDISNEALLGERTNINGDAYPNAPRDTFTAKIAELISDRLFELTGARPHIVIMRLDRNQLDVHRADPMTQRSALPLAQEVFEDYHALIDEAKAQITHNWGRGLFFDLHGHNDDRTQIELGYLLTSSKLAASDSDLDSQQYAVRSSVAAVYERAKRQGDEDFSLAAMIRGPQSLGTMLDNRGIPSLPSLDTPVPDDTQTTSYMDGGYSTRLHGSYLGGSISSIQINHPPTLRNDSSQRKTYAEAFAESIPDYFETWFDLDITQDFTIAPLRPHLTLTHGTPSQLEFERRGNLAEPLTASYITNRTPDVSLGLTPELVTFSPGQARTSVTITGQSNSSEASTLEATLSLTPGGETFNVHDAVTVEILDSQSPAVWISAIDDELEVDGQARLIVHRNRCEDLLTVTLEIEPGAEVLLDNERSDTLELVFAPGEVAREVTISSNGEVSSQPGRRDHDVWIEKASLDAYAISPERTPISVSDPTQDPDLLMWLDGWDANGHVPDLSNQNLDVYVLEMRPSPAPLMTGPLEFTSRPIALPPEHVRPGESFTLSFWFRPDQLPTDNVHHIYAHGAATQNRRGNINIILSPRNNTLRTIVTGKDEYISEPDYTQGPTSLYTLLDLPNIMEIGRLYHYALTVDMSTSPPTSTVYLDGIQMLQAERGEGGLFEAGHGSTLSNHDELSESRQFKGLMRHVRTYKRALSAAEVEALYDDAPLP